jgi:hypothetical protein
MVCCGTRQLHRRRKLSVYSRELRKLSRRQLIQEGSFMLPTFHTYKMNFSRQTYEGVARLCEHPYMQLEFDFDNHYAVGTLAENGIWYFSIEGPDHHFVGSFASRVDMSCNKQEKDMPDSFEVPVVIYPDFSTWKTFQWEIRFTPESMFNKWCSWQREEMYRSEAIYWGRSVSCTECGKHDKERNMFIGLKDSETYLNEPTAINYFCSNECWESWWEDYGFLFEKMG